MSSLTYVVWRCRDRLSGVRPFGSMVKDLTALQYSAWMSQVVPHWGIKLTGMYSASHPMIDPMSESCRILVPKPATSGRLYIKLHTLNAPPK